MPAVLYPLGHKLESDPAHVLQKALAVGVALSVVGGKLHAAGERTSVQELAPLLRLHRTELVHLLAPAANDPAPGLHHSAPDPHGAHTVPAPAAPAPPAPAPARPAPGWLHMSQSWRVADRAYESHHWKCHTCRAAAGGHTERCAAGQQLHETYDKAAQAAMHGAHHD